MMKMIDSSVWLLMMKMISSTSSILACYLPKVGKMKVIDSSVWLLPSLGGDEDD